MGILATIGLTSFVGHMQKSRTTEVKATIQAIRAAQERFRSEYLQYLNVSAATPTSSGDLTRYYPTNSPGTTLHEFYGTAGDTTRTDAANWRRLKPQITGPVRFGYATVAGLPPGSGTLTFPTTEVAVTWPASNTIVEPWYAVQAKGDLDGDGVASYALAASFSETILWKNEGE